jgi:hypothetical protein
MSHIEGGCQCGAVRYEVTAPFFAMAVCHCRACQYASGGGPNYVALAPREAFVLTKGEVTMYRSKGGSGADVGRAFCTVCGTPIYTEPAAGPFVPVKVGSLDDASTLSPALHIFTESAQPWHPVTPGLPAFPQGPPGA